MARPKKNPPTKSQVKAPQQDTPPPEEELAAALADMSPQQRKAFECYTDPTSDTYCKKRDSFVAAGYSADSAGSQASVLLSSPKFQRAMKALSRATFEEVVVSRADLIARALAMSAERSKQGLTSAHVKALELVTQLAGLKDPEEVNHHHDVAIGITDVVVERPEKK